jgi:NADPH-dependent 2,4-dienoyl-CoA reductase/sulfur reductase-like enzyme/pSer/pThr/pTyr-binding forkhead associated (FHA) protein/Fe-S-cluster-containing dehydrogenase component/CRP-like cAMP-binding protein
MRNVIVGDGVAGMSAAEAIRMRRPDAGIVVVSDDPQPYYFRASLTNYLMGELSADELWGLPKDAWEELRVERVPGRAARLDDRTREVVLESGRRIAYDRLLIASGARARRLATPDVDPKYGVEGAGTPGIHVLRTLYDAQRLVEAASRARRAVVLGGGILGLEAAQGLLARNVRVTLVHRGAWLLDTFLDVRAGELVGHRVRRAGVDVRLSTGLDAIEGDGRGVRGVRLSDGTRIETPLLVTAIGVAPNTEWLAGGAAALTKSGYVRVDDAMRVPGLEGVYAAGDLAAVAPADRPREQLWQPARAQGRVAGLNMSAEASSPPVRHEPGTLYNATRAWDLDVGTLGQVLADERAVDGRVFEDRRDDVPIYKRAAIRDGRLVGALLLGDRREGHALRRLMDLPGAAGDVSAVADRLFDPDFDLFAWVARQEEAAAGAGGWRPSVLLPRGPIPPSVAAETHLLSQRALGEAGAGAPVDGARPAVPAPRPLRLLHEGGERRFDDGPVRIGAALGCDVPVRGEGLAGEQVVLAREGLVWTAVSSEGRRAAAAVNGSPLRAPRALSDRDVVSLGEWRAVVRLGEADARPGPSPARAGGAFLLGASRHPLRRRRCSIGSGRDNDVVVREPGVSLYHAQVEAIRRADGAEDHYVVDAGSEGGTFVGDERVTVPRRLATGDVLRLGECRLVFHAQGGDPAEVGDGGADAAPRTPAPPSRGRAVFLVGREGPFAGRALAVPLGGVVGRAGSSDVRVADPLVSTVHARFEERDVGFAVVDLGSTNGVSVRGERVEPDVPHPVRDGDDVQIGRTTWTFREREPADRPKAAPVAPEPAPPPEATGFTRTVALSSLAAVLEEETEDGRRVARRLGEALVTVGRSATNHLVLAQRDVSSRHAVLERRADGGYALEDLGSRFGTRVNHRPLPPGERRALADGDRIELATVLLVYRAARAPAVRAPAPSPPARARLVPADAALARRVPALVLEGAGPFVLGRKPASRDRAAIPGTDVVVPVETVSRAHAVVARDAGGFTVRDLGSRYGTTLDGAAVGATPVALRPGATLSLQDVAMRFEVDAPEPSVPEPAPDRADAPPRRARGFAVDGAVAGHAPAARLDRVVAEEVDACIGCHDCMRACPLPDASRVTIGALNAFANGVGTPSETVLRFVQDCTQCHACVPVCPADLRRSRIVLWNKLKPQALPPPSRRVSLQFGNGRVEGPWTLGEVEARLRAHPLLREPAARAGGGRERAAGGGFEGLGQDQRLRLLGAARFRRLAPGEELLAEGEYADALWILLEGSLSVGLEQGEGRFRRMVGLAPGQTAGETSVLSDQPAEFGVRAEKASTVVGLPKHALKALAAQSPWFSRELEALYVSRSAEAALRRLPAAEGQPDEAVLALAGALDAESHPPEGLVLSAADARGAFALVRRGIVREVRVDGGREITANYLRAGDCFGGEPPPRRGTLARYEALTKVEVLTARRDHLARRLAAFPVLRDRLGSAAAAGGVAPSGGMTSWMREAGERGALQGRGVLVIDTRLCVDCDNCVSACARRYGTSRLDRGGSSMQAGPFQIPASCFHCDDPVCLLCAVDGIVREPSGEIRIVEDACIGCGACAERCPYDNIRMVPRREPEKPLLHRVLPSSLLRAFGWLEELERLPDSERVATKCDLCVGRDAKPACVRACPVGAATRVEDPVTFFAGLGGRG